MPLFALTIMFSFTSRPKWARRTRKAASRSASSSSSGARSTASASSRSSRSPSRALSASADQSEVATSSDMGFLLDQVHVQCAELLSRDLAFEPRNAVEHGYGAERLDQLGVCGAALIDAAVEDDAREVEVAAACLRDREDRVVDGSETGACDDEHREPELASEIGDRPVGTDRDEEAADPFDDRHLVPVGKPAHPRRDLVERECPALE